jgi:hypothetical protein
MAAHVPRASGRRTGGARGRRPRAGAAGRREDERTAALAAWHEMLLERFAGTPEDDLLDRLAASPALAGPELTFLRAKIAARRGDVTQAAALVTESLKELPGHTEYQDFAVKVGAKLPPRAREMVAERARIPR